MIFVIYIGGKYDLISFSEVCFCQHLVLSLFNFNFVTHDRTAQIPAHATGVPCPQDTELSPISVHDYLSTRDVMRNADP